MADENEDWSPFAYDLSPITVTILLTSFALMGLVSYIFVRTQVDRTELAASAFVIAAIFALMPWQLASPAAGSEKHKCVVDQLIWTGVQMATASVVFMSAAILRYTCFNVEEIWEIDKEAAIKWQHALWPVSSLLFMSASLVFVYAMCHFSAIIRRMANKK